MFKTNPKISVIIPTYNGILTLEKCIKSIWNQSLKPVEILVIDNASTDHTGHLLHELSGNISNLKIITNHSNLGVTGGRNKGIELADKSVDFLLFFDHDMYADKNMLAELSKVTLSDKTIGITTPKIYYFQDKKRIWAAGTGMNLISGQVLFRGGIDKGQFDVIEEVQVAPAAIFVKKEVLIKVHSFDKRYFATYEDTDFCFRAKKEGFKVYYVPGAIAYHDLPIDLEAESVRLLSRSYYIGKNRIMFMRDFGKNFYIFLIFLPVFILYYLYLSLKYHKFSAWLKFIKGTIEGILF